MINHKIQTFLIQKLKENNLSKKEFAALSKISYPTVCDLVIANNVSPSLQTIIKIAKTFSCSIDEVVGRENKYLTDSSDFISINYDKALDNLRSYLQQKIESKNLRVYSLGKVIGLGFNTESIANFIKSEGDQKSIGSAIIIKLADYFDVSIDEMIGRVQTQKDESMQSEVNQ